jgi:hypothetical protein
MVVRVDRVFIWFVAVIPNQRDSQTPDSNHRAKTSKTHFFMMSVPKTEGISNVQAGTEAKTNSREAIKMQNLAKKAGQVIRTC